MRRNERNALLALLGGIGLIFLVAGIFLPQIEFVYGLFAAIVCWIAAGVMKAYFDDEKS